MKRYIAAILIPCFLLQLCGCYSWRIVETPEPGSNIKIYTKNYKVIEPKNWRYEDGNIVGFMGEEKLEGYTAVKVETKMEQKEINKIEEEYLNITNTSILIGGIVIVGLLILYVIFAIEANEEMVKEVGELLNN
jgi:hypothetical protein